MINNRFNVVYHLLYLVKKIILQIKNTNMTFSEYIINERSVNFYKICLGDCIRFGITIEELLSNTYTEWNILYNSK
jgi:hypothetical protein